ncbi:hypothetical protein CDX27_03270 [Campylobacter coli]|nr:hypothetical protein [Campylobacter jejuni]EAI6361685.1 hypothetical protein [Campylobacter coli]EKJ5774703.1 hypothetical protein [Campylobacter coli]
MKKILTSVLSLGAMFFIIGCGDGDLVELKNNGHDQALFDLGNKKLLEKYPNYKLYDIASLKSVNFIKNGNQVYNGYMDFLEKSRKREPYKYKNVIFLVDNNQNYKLALISCEESQCFIYDKTKDLH